MPAATPSSSRPRSSSSCVSFVERYLEGDFPADSPPEQPADLCFNPKSRGSPPVPPDQEQHTSLQSLATSVQGFFNHHGFLPAVKTLSGGLERDRARAIQRFGLDTPSLWPLADRCARIAHVVFKAPILITLIEADTQLVLAASGCGFEPRQALDYGKSLCSHTALRTDGTMLEIPDTQKDWRFQKTPDVPGAYVGQPILLPVHDGGRSVPVAAFCVLGDGPRPLLTAEERESLSDLAHLLTTDIHRAFQDAVQRKETLRRQFISELAANLSSFHSTISPPVDPSAGPEVREPPDPESMLSVTADVRRMLDSDFACLVDLSSLRLSWKTETPRPNVSRSSSSRSKHAWVSSDLNPVKQAPSGSGLRIIDYSCSDECRDFSPEIVLNAPLAVPPLINFLRAYTTASTAGYTYSGSDGMLQYLLPRDSQAHIAIPLFSNAQPALLLLVSTSKPLHIYEPADMSFASTFAVMCLGSLAKMKLMTSDASKTTFLSTISHELRTPLHGLLSQLELIREFAPKEFLAETEWFLQAAEVCGLTLRDVVNDVLDFGKQEQGGTGDLHAYCTEIDLSVLATEIMNVAYGRRRQWESASGELESVVKVYVDIEDCPTGWGALTDVGGLRRVLLNLASNALKYTPKGTIVLSLRELTVQPRDKPSDGRRMIEFSMVDTGIGMSSEYKKDIFTPFSQESTFNPGSGLGMSISESILARLGGEMTISSERGKGTTVSFTLPIDFLEPRPVRKDTDRPRAVTKTLISLDDSTLLAKASSPTPSASVTPPAKPEVGPRHASSLDTPTPRRPPLQPVPSGLQNGATDVRVLVVEDNHISRKILTTLLTRKGVPFREAADGLAALAVYREFLPNLVWTDVSMPVMDGIESARQMRMIENELQIQPPAHIVALTGLSSHGEMKEALLGEAALDEWLVKGQANLKTLFTGLEKVQRALRGSAASSPLTPISVV
ncbi:hypothetical protein C8R47DRAFT_1215480 [Mycena vitilis]|nr:hypothetical protein C8R47DRAFT_1215480 [Mycena vitilis]